jgi:hypothetical protein
MRKLIRPCDLLSLSDPEGTIVRVRTLEIYINEEKERKISEEKKR